MISSLDILKLFKTRVRLNDFLKLRHFSAHWRHRDCNDKGVWGCHTPQRRLKNLKIEKVKTFAFFSFSAEMFPCFSRHFCCLHTLKRDTCSYGFRRLPGVFKTLKGSLCKTHWLIMLLSVFITVSQSSINFGKNLVIFGLFQLCSLLFLTAHHTGHI